MGGSGIRPSPGTEVFKSCREGFAGYGMRNDSLELVVLPELGAKVISLRSMLTGREWMWHPGGELRLFRNRTGDRFEESTLAGADECLPTIAPCALAGRNVPDHGEAWSASWEIDSDQFERGVLCTRLKLPASPFYVERRISLHGNEACLEYRLQNLGGKDEAYLWGFHPLFSIDPCDRIELPDSIRTVIVGPATGALEAKTGCVLPWPEPIPGTRLDRLEPGATDYAKVFADFAACDHGWAAIRRGPERLAFSFAPHEIRYLGIWSNRGQWNGHVHMALEPTTAATDAVSDVAGCEMNRLPPHGERRWSFRIRIDCRDDLSRAG